MSTPFYAAQLASALRRHVGRGGTYSVEAFSDRTGIEPRRIYMMRDQEACVRLDEFIVMARELPADFAAEVVKPAGVTSVAKGEDTDATVRSATTMRRLTEKATQLAEALEDGIVDHREAADLLPEFQRLRSDLDAYLTRLRRKTDDGSVVPFSTQMQQGEGV